MNYYDKKLNRYKLATLILFVLLCVVSSLYVAAVNTQIETTATLATVEDELLETQMAIDVSHELLALAFGEWHPDVPTKTTGVRVTCYTSRKQETDDTPHITADGSTVQVGYIAVSRDMLRDLGLEMGQRILLTGYGVFEVRDVMNARYTRSVDIWMQDRKAAMLHGVKFADIVWQ